MFASGVLTAVLLRAAARASQRGRGLEDGPVAFAAGLDLLAEHPADHGAASLSPARAGADTGTPAYHLEGFCSGLDCFDDDALADFVAQADRSIGVDDRLFAGFS